MAIVISFWEKHYEEILPSHFILYDLFKIFDDTGLVADALRSRRPPRISKTFVLIVMSLTDDSLMLQNEKQEVLKSQEGRWTK